MSKVLKAGLLLIVLGFILGIAAIWTNGDLSSRLTATAMLVGIPGVFVTLVTASTL